LLEAGAVQEASMEGALVEVRTRLAGLDGLLANVIRADGDLALSPISFSEEIYIL
jgi:hypothetical protein